MTFPLYLFHRPLLQFFSYVGPEDAGSFARRILVVGGTLAVVHFATPACDRLRDIIRRSVLARLEAGIPVGV
jgi:peptidoglycan/LPS O-acetylase OafA/YrhL